MAYATTPLLGANLSNTLTSLTSDPGNTLSFKVGDTVAGSEGSLWQFVKASAAITAYDCVAIDENGDARPMTKALADTQPRVGFAQNAIASGHYGWVALYGQNLRVRVNLSCAADTNLYTTGTAGILDDTSTTQTLIAGVVITTAADTSGPQDEQAIVNFPRAVT